MSKVLRQMSQYVQQFVTLVELVAHLWLQADLCQRRVPASEVADRLVEGRGRRWQSRRGRSLRGFRIYRCTRVVSLSCLNFHPVDRPTRKPD